jgi:hypothetical protein
VNVKASKIPVIKGIKILRKGMLFKVFKKSQKKSRQSDS